MSRDTRDLYCNKCHHMTTHKRDGRMWLCQTTYCMGKQPVKYCLNCTHCPIPCGLEYRTRATGA